MVGDGARPNLFEVSLNFPILTDNSIAASQQSTFLAKSAQLPGSTIGVVPVYYFGREVKFAGNRTFADWTVQIINDESFLIRRAIEQWMNSINAHAGNIRSATAGSPSEYSVDAAVTQFGKVGDRIKKYDFVGMFPVDLAPIDLDWGQNDVIEEYAVTFAYQYWTASDSTDN